MNFRNKLSDDEKLNLFRALFKGREDVFAIQWQKGNKSGYMPAFDYDPYRYRLHKMKGGTFKNYPDKSYLPLTDYQLLRHFKGEQLIGIYPLLNDNTSWFITADFDKENWAEESVKLIKALRQKGIPAYLERSRSGKGGHVWMFFENPFPAFKSRKILINILEETGIFSIFDKQSSFDRLFPNQDYLSGKGFGNLIALPLHKPALDNGNSCFVDENLQAYENQWDFLSKVQKASDAKLNQLYERINYKSSSLPSDNKSQSKKLQIKLSNSALINKPALTKELINFLKESLIFANSEFFIKKKSAKSTWGTQKYFNLIEENNEYIEIPRGFVGKLIRYCSQNEINFEFHDQRSKHNSVKFSSRISLRTYQEPAIEAASKKDFGIISAPPGSGKTIIGLKIIADKQQPALILAHRRHLLDQWIERIQGFLGIPKNEIGRIGSGYTQQSTKRKNKSNKAITVAMLQSIGKLIEKEPDKLVNSFGTIIIDECHHMPARTYSNVISKLSPYYQYGLTATPFRKNTNDKIIFAHLGEIIVNIKPTDIEQYKRPRLIVRKTSLDIPFNSKTDPFEVLSKVLVHDSARNKLLLKDITGELDKGKKVVIITERTEHIEIFNQFLKQSFETIRLSGQDSETKRKLKWNTLKSGNYQALITTGQYFGEGSDLSNASCLFLVYPFSFKGKLIQYIGRVQRSEITPVIYDYDDHKIEYLHRLFLKRNAWYRHLDRQATLFDDVNTIGNSSRYTETIRKTISIPIENLDFRYGAIAFKYESSSTNMEFEIEHNEIRPEFDVLKPYFSKVLRKKSVRTEIFAEIENNRLVSQMATSKDLEKINNEIIESVKFQYLQKGIIGRDYSGEKKSILGLNELQEEESSKALFDQEDELLEALLKNQKVKHYRQLRYLASKHKRAIVKLRFVLNPFSFVFLLQGQKQYHIILETLDTKEATYLWHFDKDQPSLLQNLEIIDKQLNIIRNKGRQEFLKNPSDNFSRIIHDYSDERKGFIIWKDQLKERLA